jgi:hypothetical protein
MCPNPYETVDLVSNIRENPIREPSTAPAKVIIPKLFKRG